MKMKKINETFESLISQFNIEINYYVYIFKLTIYNFLLIFFYLFQIHILLKFIILNNLNKKINLLILKNQYCYIINNF